MGGAIHCIYIYWELKPIKSRFYHGALKMCLQSIAAHNPPPPGVWVSAMYSRQVLCAACVSFKDASVGYMAPYSWHWLLLTVTMIAATVAAAAEADAIYKMKSN